MTRLSDEQSYQSTPNKILHEQLMNPNVPKNEREWYASRLIEKLQGEIERLKPFASAYENINEYFCGEDIVAKYESSQLELAQLTAKHERFVNVAREFHDYIIMHPVKAFDVPDEIYIPFNNALTEEGNV